jgi:hypothetical protein
LNEFQNLNEFQILNEFQNLNNNFKSEHFQNVVKKGLTEKEKGKTGEKKKRKGKKHTTNWAGRGCVVAHTHQNGRCTRAR